MKTTKGFVQRTRHSSSGNACLLVITDSAAAFYNHAIVDQTILVALEHFGMPYRILDLARERPTARALSRCAAIILAQNALGASLSKAETILLADAVKEGVGLVNFDNDLRQYQAPFLEMFGFARINPHPFVTNSLRIRPPGHYITAMQAPGEFHEFDRPVTAVMAEEWRKDVVPLAEGILAKDQLVYIRHLAPWSAFVPGNYPVVFAGRWGRGKAVQFTLNPRVWHKSFFGHGRGIDDLFWRSIVWAARKPFVANLIPPFITMSIDDCSGRHDLEYADVANRHGYIPMPSLFLKDIPKQLFPKIKAGLDSRQVVYNTHALDYYHLLLYNFGKCEYSRDELTTLFAFEDQWWKTVGAKPGVTIRGHWGEYGVNALPFLKQRGRLFFCPPLQPGLHKADMCLQGGYWPYGLANIHYDYLPDDHDFYGFSTMFKRHTEDFLMGCLVLLKESAFNDLEKAAHNAAAQVALGLRAGFPAEICTHEQKFEVLSLNEWDRILARTGQLTEAFEKIFAGHDDIARYLKSKDGTWIAEAQVQNGRIRCRLAGHAGVPLKASLFHDEDDSVIRDYLDIAAFSGSVRAESREIRTAVS